MTPATLAQFGHLLFGPRWRAELAKALDVHQRTVVRWARGDTAMPEDLPCRLIRIAEAKERAALRARLAMEQAR